MAERIELNYGYYMEKHGHADPYWWVNGLCEYGMYLLCVDREEGGWRVEDPNDRYNRIPDSPLFSTPEEAGNYGVIFLITGALE